LHGNQIRYQKLPTGIHGLHGVLDLLIYPFFDTFPLDHQDYWTLRQLFADFCTKAVSGIAALVKVTLFTIQSRYLLTISISGSAEWCQVPSQGFTYSTTY